MKFLLVGLLICCAYVAAHHEEGHHDHEPCILHKILTPLLEHAPGYVNDMRKCLEANGKMDSVKETFTKMETLMNDVVAQWKNLNCAEKECSDEDNQAMYEKVKQAKQYDLAMGDTTCKVVEDAIDIIDSIEDICH